MSIIIKYNKLIMYISTKIIESIEPANETYPFWNDYY